MIWTAGSLAFLVCVGAAIAFLLGSEILAAHGRMRSSAPRQAQPPSNAAPTRREPCPNGRLPTAAPRQAELH
ncbi:MAG: hypothetical protein ACLQJR_22140 [Stellaceae bacterium]